MFSQILKLIPRTDFERFVKETKAEHRSKGLSSWSQFVAMLFCQLGRAHSLREIEGRLKSCEGKLVHLGIEAPASALNFRLTPMDNNRVENAIRPIAFGKKNWLHTGSELAVIRATVIQTLLETAKLNDMIPLPGSRILWRNCQPGQTPD